MQSTSPQIVHESETQRQFVRLKMPARIEIDGDQYPVRDLSPGGVGAEGVGRTYGDGAELAVKLILPFEGFSLDVDVTARVRHFTHASKILGLQFVNLQPDQVSILTYVVKAYIAGDVLKVGDVLAITARENFVKVRKKKDMGPVQYSPLFRTRQFVGTGAIALLGVVVAVFVVANIYESTFMLKTTEGVVGGDIVTIRASESGIFDSDLTEDALKVSKGQSLGTLGLDTAVNSPCDCAIFETEITSGAYVSAGDVLYRLVPQNTTMYVTATVPMAQAYRLKIGGAASARIAGTNIEIKGTVKSIVVDSVDPSSPYAALARPVARVRVELKDKTVPDFINRPALVKFRL